MDRTFEWVAGRLNGHPVLYYFLEKAYRGCYFFSGVFSLFAGILSVITGMCVLIVMKWTLFNFTAGLLILVSGIAMILDHFDALVPTATAAGREIADVSRKCADNAKQGWHQGGKQATIDFLNRNMGAITGWIMMLFGAFLLYLLPWVKWVVIPSVLICFVGLMLVLHRHEKLGAFWTRVGKISMILFEWCLKALGTLGRFLGTFLLELVTGVYGKGICAFIWSFVAAVICYKLPEKHNVALLWGISLRTALAVTAVFLLLFSLYLAFRWVSGAAKKKTPAELEAAAKERLQKAGRRVMSQK